MLETTEHPQKATHTALSETFSQAEWMDIMLAARERQVPIQALVHDAVMLDLFR
jgi:hypothetical protein